jgi:hypothetical protein
MLFTSGRTLLLFAAAVLVMPACGGSATTGGAPSAPSGPTAVVITIASGGSVSPKNVVVPAGSQISFVNHDTVDHLMFSDPHPEHTDCPDLNAVGFLTPGQTRQSGNLNVVRTCGFHDHMNPTVASLRGTITIQ